MKIFKTVRDFRDYREAADVSSLGVVATMGALHEGHGSLIKKSIQENERTCVSVFVNPTQFNEKKDFECYPSTMEKDLKFCESLGVDCVFNPSADEIYGDGGHIRISEDEITKNFEGAHRPGHFNGVLQVVLKLLNIISPQRAYFGEKDYQQYLVIKKMAKDLFLKTEIVGVEISRDEYGLALSSRNLNLSDAGLERARQVASVFLRTNTKDHFLETLGGEVELELEYYGEEWGRILMAHYIDGVRLIDNKEVPK